MPRGITMPAARSLPSAGSSPSFRLRSPSLNTVRLHRVFDLFDCNSDGEITVDELALALDCLGLGTDSDEIGCTVAAYISPDRTGLAFDDFEVLHRSLGNALFYATAPGDEGPTVAKEGEQDMREAFQMFDKDGDGFISAAELCRGLGADRDEIGCTIAAYISLDHASLAFNDFEVLHRSPAMLSSAPPHLATKARQLLWSDFWRNTALSVSVSITPITGDLLSSSELGHLKGKT